MRKSMSRGFGRNGELDYDELDKEASDGVIEGDNLHKMAEKFLSDKTKLEEEIEKVQASGISESDKAKIIAELDEAIYELQRQYDLDVAVEESRVQDNIQSQIDMMDVAIDELEQQVESLGEVKMDIATTDAKAAADEADSKKKEFEQMKKDYADKLKLQIEQAEMLRKQILMDNIKGR